MSDAVFVALNVQIANRWSESFIGYVNLSCWHHRRAKKKQTTRIERIPNSFSAKGKPNQLNLFKAGIEYVLEITKLFRQHSHRFACVYFSISRILYSILEKKNDNSTSLKWHTIMIFIHALYRIIIISNGFHLSTILILSIASTDSIQQAAYSLCFAI